MSQPVIFFNGKKGVSPLIATVLLIAFAVALGAVIMNWGRSFVQERTTDVEETTKTETSCSLDVQLKVTEISGTPQVCYGGSGSNGYIEFTIENQGKKAIESLGIVIGGSNGIYNNASLNSTSIILGGAVFKNITYDFSTYGPVRYITFIPSIDVGGATTVCSGSRLQKDTNQIRNCTAS